MYFVWQQRLFASLSTLDGDSIDVLHTGQRNYDAGPDFFNAKVIINGVRWAGNVEMHVKSSDWIRHHHDTDAAYNSVILHVVLEADMDIMPSNREKLETVVMKIPDGVLERYRLLSSGLRRTTPLLPGQVQHYTSISCFDRLKELPHIVKFDWLSSCCLRRMEEKKKRVLDVVNEQMKSWDEACFLVLTRSLGTGVNSDAMERLARSLPYAYLLHHKDNLLQVQALLLGQAGMLQLEDASQKPEALQKEWITMQREYAFLKQKFRLEPMPGTMWKTGCIRPPAQPEARLRVLAHLIHHNNDLLSALREAKDVEVVKRILHVKGLGEQTVQSLIINAVVPMQLAYAEWRKAYEDTESAFAMLEALPAEKNRYVKQWEEAGLEIRSAVESQGALELFKRYCQPHKCLWCRIGGWLLKHPVSAD